MPSDDDIPIPVINNKVKILHTIISFKRVDKHGKQGLGELPDFTVGHALIDDEQSPAGWSTRLVERVRLKSYVITFCLQAASGAPFPVIRPKQLLNVKKYTRT